MIRDVYLDPGSGCKVKKNSMDPGSGTLQVFLYLVVVALDLEESRKTFCKHGNSWSTWNFRLRLSASPIPSTTEKESDTICTHHSSYGYQCCGSESGGSVCFWASRIRILLSSRKKGKKNLYFYRFVTSFFDFLSFKTVRFFLYLESHWRRAGSGSESVTQCYES